MNSTTYQYTFHEHVPFEEIESTLLMAVISAESLLGESVVRLDANHVLDRPTRSCQTCADTEVGSTINLLFAGYVCRQYGDAAFQVRRHCAADSRGKERTSGH